MKLFLDDGGGDGRSAEARSIGGDLAPIVLVHGLGADSQVWSAQLDHLRKTRRALAPDLRGHGRSQSAGEYTVQSIVGDLLESLRLQEKFWLVGHSFSGSVVSRFAGEHPGRLAGVIFVDAVGDVSNPPPEIRAFFDEQHKDLSWPKLEKLFGEMIGPRGKPGTRRRLLSAVANMDLAAFPALRESMLQNPGRELLARFPGPKFAIEADDAPSDRTASSLPGVQRKTIPDVSHWLMLDDPQGTNRALDEVLAWTG